MYGDPASCPLVCADLKDDDLLFGPDCEDDPSRACTGPVPYRLIVTIIGALCHVIVSYGAYFLFTRRKVDLKWDFFNSFKEGNSGEVSQAGSKQLLDWLNSAQNRLKPKLRLSLALNCHGIAQSVF